MNITDINATPLHAAFDEVSRAAAARGVSDRCRNSGTRAPTHAHRGRQALPAASAAFRRHPRRRDNPHGHHLYGAVGTEAFRRKRKDNREPHIQAGHRRHDGHDLPPLRLRDRERIARTRRRFNIRLYGRPGAALATMVANLSAHKPGWDARWEEFSEVAEKGQNSPTACWHSSTKTRPHSTG